MTVLASIDGSSTSEAIIERGAELATALGEDLLVLHAVPEASSSDTEEPEGIAREIVENTLSETSNVQVVGHLGDPEVRILREADDADASYIVMGSRKQSPVGKALFGSIAQVVLLNTDRPVVVVSEEG
ncbi:universal stress protein [Halobacteriales archaeon QS_3_64_16]|nr:MAG: universal stress protein [Halobacteriales archaeon QS_3_64_16]